MKVIDFTICDKYGMYIWGKKNIYYAFEDGEFSYINRSMVPNISLSQAQLVYDLIKEEEKGTPIRRYNKIIVNQKLLDPSKWK